MLNAEVEDRKNRQKSADAINRNLNNQLNMACLNMNKQFKEILRLKHKVYVLKKDIKRKDRAIVRYKAQNEVFKHGYHETEERNKKLRRMYTTEIQTEQWLRSMWYATMDERDAYLYCLRQIQEEVENAKKE
jgi:predicted transcriptional regulator